MTPPLLGTRHGQQKHIPDLTSSPSEAYTRGYLSGPGECPPHLELPWDTVESTMADVCSAGRVVTAYTLSFLQGPYVDTFTLLRLYVVLPSRSPEQRQPSLVCSPSSEMRFTLVAIQAKPRLCSTPLWLVHRTIGPVRQSMRAIRPLPSVRHAARERLLSISLDKSTPRTDSCDRAEMSARVGPLKRIPSMSLELRLCLG